MALRIRASRHLPGRVRGGREPRASELVLALTAVAALAAGCLYLVAALSA